jgi:hypothetical protein
MSPGHNLTQPDIGVFQRVFPEPVTRLLRFTTATFGQWAALPPNSWLRYGLAAQ